MSEATGGPLPNPSFQVKGGSSLFPTERVLSARAESGSEEIGTDAAPKKLVVQRGCWIRRPGTTLRCLGCRDWACPPWDITKKGLLEQS